MPKDIASLARTLLHEPVRVEVAPPSTTVERVKQHVCFVAKPSKRLLLQQVLRDEAIERVLVFTRTKHGANRVATQLIAAGTSAAAIHGNKSQGARERALGAFRAGQLRVLVATDIAARGIDVPEITHVINFDLPNEPESYVHRIGRTGRAGRSGVAVSFCDDTEGEYLKALGAAQLLDRSELSSPSKRPLASTRWAGGIDVAGSHTLANMLAATQPGGAVAACGLAQGMDLPGSVAPFILRGLTLIGIDSVYATAARRAEAWRRLASDLDRSLLESMITEIGLDEVPAAAADILAGNVRGRFVVDVSG